MYIVHLVRIQRTCFHHGLYHLGCNWEEPAGRRPLGGNLWEYNNWKDTPGRRAIGERASFLLAHVWICYITRAGCCWLLSGRCILSEHVLYTENKNQNSGCSAKVDVVQLWVVKLWVVKLPVVVSAEDHDSIFLISNASVKAETVVCSRSMLLWAVLGFCRASVVSMDCFFYNSMCWLGNSPWYVGHGDLDYHFFIFGCWLCWDSDWILAESICCLWNCIAGMIGSHGNC